MAKKDVNKEGKMVEHNSNVVFRAKRSTAYTCICNACHNIGFVTKITYPETYYHHGLSLETDYDEFWLCDDCKTKLLTAIKEATDG